jgi:hypothetical protein
MNFVQHVEVKRSPMEPCALRPVILSSLLCTQPSDLRPVLCLSSFPCSVSGDGARLACYSPSTCRGRPLARIGRDRPAFDVHRQARIRLHFPAFAPRAALLRCAM